MQGSLNLFLMEKALLEKAFNKYPDKTNLFIAQKLGISDTNLYQKMKLHQIERKRVNTTAK
jgi:transcriptional regulator with PAS, ATPase and Fis domain